MFIGVKRESVRWLLAETLVVVLGILIAFQIEEWRIEWIEREQEAETLRSLLIDFDIGEREYQLWEEGLLKTRANTKRLIELLWAEEVPSVEVLEPLLQLENKNYETRYWAPTATAFLSARASGHFSLISDHRLRKGLTDYFDTMEPFLLETRKEQQASLQAFFAAVKRETIATPAKDFFESGEVLRTLAVPVAQFPSDPGFKDVLLNYHERTERNIRRIHFARSLLEDFREQIKAQLDD